MSTSTSALAEEVVSPNETELTAEFTAFLKAVSLRRAGDGPVRRFNQGRHSGCVEAEFVVRDDLPDHLRVGLFAVPRTYRAFIRFANATSATDRDRDGRGMSVKLADVPGPNLTEGSTTQDFVLNSHPVMVAPNTKEFLALLQAIEAGRLQTALFFARRPRLLRIGLASQGRPTSHLDINYWSTTPYLFGQGRAVKYIARPRSDRTSPMPGTLTDNYLRDALRKHLAEAEAAFDFMIQFQVDSRRMPIEDATIEWDQQESPYVPVAHIRIPRQDIDDADRTKRCEEAAFNPWNGLPEHRPLGSLNRARRQIYRSLAQLRRERP